MGAARGNRMNAKQWLLITFVVILNIIILGALFQDPEATASTTPTPTWTPRPTYTPMPFPTATAILMPTAAAPAADVVVPTPATHVVLEGESLESIADQYGVGPYMLRLLNRMTEEEDIEVGQELIVPEPE